MSIVYFDSDFLISFLCLNDSLFWLVEKTLIDYEYVIPKEVLTEITRRTKDGNATIDAKRTKQLVTSKKIAVYEMDISDDAALLKHHLQSESKFGKQMGAGEAASYALAKTKKGILASNNLRDVAENVRKHEVILLTTSKVIKRAYEEAIISKSDAEKIWANMNFYGRRMPTNTFDEYLQLDEPWPL